MNVWTITLFYVTSMVDALEKICSPVCHKRRIRINEFVMEIG